MFFIENTQSPYREIENYLRNSVGLDEDDVQLILKRYEKKFNTYEFSPRIYSNQVSSEDLSRRFWMHLKSEDELDQMLNMINPIQLSSKGITKPWWKNWLHGIIF